MRKTLATLLACFFLLYTAGALASAHGACCAEDCKAVQCVSMGCHTCASPAIAAPAAAGGSLDEPTQAVPVMAPTAIASAEHEVWRPPD